MERRKLTSKLYSYQIESVILLSNIKLKKLESFPFWKYIAETSNKYDTYIRIW